jgi:hypothetical protein
MLLAVTPLKPMLLLICGRPPLCCSIMMGWQAVVDGVRALAQPPRQVAPRSNELGNAAAITTSARLEAAMVSGLWLAGTLQMDKTRWRARKQHTTHAHVRAENTAAAA